jgi:SAM-dependent methyltransferase
MSNIDHKTVESFGDEWLRFDQSGMSEVEAKKVFEEYFRIFPWSVIPPEAEGFDMGCGSGRWARFMAPLVGRLHCIDPSAAIEVAKSTLSAFHNVVYHKAAVDDPGISEGSQDFGYSLGVLHHIPDTAAAIKSCVSLLKPGAPLLLYLYYAFDNRPVWFRTLWRVSDSGRKVIYRLPPGLKHFVANVIAAIVYWPLARLSGLLERLNIPVHGVPLSYYRNHTFYTMCTDARDRFGTPLEQRFSRQQITSMMKDAGLTRIKISESAPYWCVVGLKG